MFHTSKESFFPFLFFLFLEFQSNAIDSRCCLNPPGQKPPSSAKQGEKLWKLRLYRCVTNCLWWVSKCVGGDCANTPVSITIGLLTEECKGKIIDLFFGLVLFWAILRNTKLWAWVLHEGAINKHGEVVIWVAVAFPFYAAIINKTFSSTELQLTGYFFLVGGHSLDKKRVPLLQQLVKHTNSLSATKSNRVCHVQCHINSLSHSKSPRQQCRDAPVASMWLAHKPLVDWQLNTAPNKRGLASVCQLSLQSCSAY